MPFKMTSRTMVAVGGLSFFCGTLALGYQAGAKRVGQPTRIATVNLSAVMEKLDQRASAQANLTTMGDKLQQEDATRKAEITKMQNDLKEMAESADRDVLQEKLALNSLKYRAWAEGSTRRLDIEQALVLEDLYRNVKQAAEQLAQAMKLDLVLVNDAEGQLARDANSRIPQRDQVMQQIGGRRMLFADPAIDVTDELIERMNNAFRTAGGGTTGAANPKQP